MKITTIGIYKITSPSRKIYIGQSINIESRFRYYRRKDCKRQRKLHHSFEKYGIQSHKFEIIHICEEKELNDLEVHYIKLYDTFNTEHGLNLRAGGESKGALSDETKELVRQANLGKKYSAETNLKKGRKGHSNNKGHIVTEETKQKLRIAFSGKNNPNYGKKHSPETRKIMSEKVLASPRIWTDEERAYMSKLNKGKTHSEDTKKRISLLTTGKKKSLTLEQKIAHVERLKKRWQEMTDDQKRIWSNKTQSKRRNVRQEKLMMIF